MNEWVRKRAQATYRVGLLLGIAALLFGDVGCGQRAPQGGPPPAENETKVADVSEIRDFSGNMDREGDKKAVDLLPSAQKKEMPPRGRIETVREAHPTAPAAGAPDSRRPMPGKRPGDGGGSGNETNGPAFEKGDLNGSPGGYFGGSGEATRERIIRQGGGTASGKGMPAKGEKRPRNDPALAKSDKEKKADEEPQVWQRDRGRPTFARVYVGDGNSLELVSLHVSVTVEGPRARTLVDHVFRNPHDRQLEGTFEYPLPTGASPSYFAMFLGQTRDTVPPRFRQRRGTQPAAGRGPRPA